MHILFSACDYPRPGAPFTAFVSEIVEEMARQGHKITVVAPQSITSSLRHKKAFVSRDYYYEVKDKDRNVKIRVLRPLSLTFGYGKLLKLSRLIDRIVVMRAVSKLSYKFDVVYSHFWTSAFNIMPFVQKNKIPFFVATGEDVINITKWSGKKFVRQTNEFVKGVICVSTKNKIESVTLGLINEEKCRVFPNSINPDKFYPIDKITVRNKFGFSNDTFIVAFCGRFNYRKGVMRLNEALKSLGNENIKLILIGSLVENETLIPDYSGIIHIGQVPHDLIVGYLNCADVFVLPTLAEGCSNSIVEAMGCGLPIISSDLPFNYDILDNGNAILIDPLNIDELKNAILKIYQDKEMQNKMSSNSYIKAQNLRIDNRVKRIIDFIKELM